jgi:hypothetical protein
VHGHLRALKTSNIFSTCLTACSAVEQSTPCSHSRHQLRAVSQDASTARR